MEPKRLAAGTLESVRKLMVGHNGQGVNRHLALDLLAHIAAQDADNERLRTTLEILTDAPLNPQDTEEIARAALEATE